MERGITIDLHLVPGIPDERFVAEALGNLAAFELQSARREKLEWQVLCVTGTGPHHYRLALRHPERRLDLGLTRELERTLDRLSDETPAELRSRFDRAVRDGMKPVPLRNVREEVDFWQDDFWNWIG